MPDATRAARAPRDIDVGTDQAAVALPAGGALIVTSVPNALIGATVLHVTADGDLEQASPVGGDVPRVSLFAAANGAPILWTGARWLRWRPWEGTFGPLGLDAPGPALGAASAVGDPGLLVWTQEGRLVGMRVDVRGPYSTEPRPLLREDPGPLVPDRLVSSSAVSPLRFDPPTGLTLPAKASVFLADATYANVAVTVDASAGPPPLVVLRTESGVEVELGGATCPAPPQNPWTLTRRGARARFQSAGGDGASCDLPSIGSARVAVGLRGAGPSPTIVRELTLERR